MIKDECLAIFLNTQFLNKHTKIEDFPLSKTSFLKTDVREVMILCDINKEEIFSHKLLKIKENKKENRKLSSERIIIEQINAKIKVFKITKYPYRNRRKKFNLRMNLICAIVNLDAVPIARVSS